VGLGRAGRIDLLAPLQAGTWAADRRLESIYPEFRNYLTEMVWVVRTFQLPLLSGGASAGEGARGWGAAAWRAVGATMMREGAIASVF
jgi:hypothetical protein